MYFDCLVGIGNGMRADDGVGLLVATIFRWNSNIRTCVSDGSVDSILDSIRGFQNVVIVDCAKCHNMKSGSILAFDVSLNPLPQLCAHRSTHSMNLGDSIELARLCRLLPRQTNVVAVVGGEFSAGIAMSDEVRHSALLVAFDLLSGIVPSSRFF